jgi:hypothetical protein
LNFSFDSPKYVENYVYPDLLYYRGIAINSLPLFAPGTQRDIKEVTYRTHLDALLKQEFLENVSSSSSLLTKKTASYGIRRIKCKKKVLYIKKVNLISHKNRTHFCKHTTKENSRQTEVCWSAAL